MPKKALIPFVKVKCIPNKGAYTFSIPKNVLDSEIDLRKGKQCYVTVVDGVIQISSGQPNVIISALLFKADSFVPQLSTR